MKASSIRPPFNPIGRKWVACRLAIRCVDCAFRLRRKTSAERQQPFGISFNPLAVAEDRDPFPNAVQSANWTCVGLCAHQSALKGGALVNLPAFTL